MAGRRIAASILCLLASLPAPAQSIEELQFVNQPITDILVSLAQLSHRSIVPDETVTGTATYYFARAEFDEALAAFLEANHLYAVKRNDAYFVSRVRAELNPQSRLVRLDAEEVEIQAILRALSRAIDRKILVDGSPRTQATVHMDGLSVEAALGVIVRTLGDYELDVQPTHYYVRKRAQAPSAAAVTETTKKPLISRDGELYSIHADKMTGSVFYRAGPAAWGETAGCRAPRRARATAWTGKAAEAPQHPRGRRDAINPGRRGADLEEVCPFSPDASGA